MIRELVIAFVAAVAPAPSAATLDTCRQRDREFDTKAMVPVCQAAADDTSLAVPDRIDAYRLLAFAHVLNGNEALAEPAFMKMLVLGGDTTIAADAGARIAEIFSRVKARFVQQGQVSGTFTPPADSAPAPVTVDVEVKDQLDRVAAARLRSTWSLAGKDTVKEVSMVRAELGPGRLRFSSQVPQPTAIDGAPSPDGPLRYEIVFEGWDGSVIAPATPLAGTRTLTPPEAHDADAAGPPWLLIAGGAGAAVVVAGAMGAGVAYCYIAGPCGTANSYSIVHVVAREAP